MKARPAKREKGVRDAAAETVRAVRTWAADVATVANIKESKSELAYHLAVEPVRAEAKGFKLSIGSNGCFDLYCGAIRCESEQIPAPAALTNFCESIAAGRIIEKE